jgi:hypothetical protein
VLDRMRGAPGSTAILTIVRNGADQPVDIAVVRQPIGLRALLRVKAESGSLSVEAIGGRRVFDFDRSRPTPVLPLPNTEFMPMPAPPRASRSPWMQRARCPARCSIQGWERREDRLTGALTLRVDQRVGRGGNRETLHGGFSAGDGKLTLSAPITWIYGSGDERVEIVPTYTLVFRVRKLIHVFDHGLMHRIT